MNNATAIQTPTKYQRRPSYFDATPGKYSGNSEDGSTRFNALVKRWRLETAYVSSIDQIVNNPSFKDIVAMGTCAVPLVVAEIERQPDLLVAALSLITHEDPVAPDDRGNVYAMVVAWLDWFHRRNP